MTIANLLLRALHQSLRTVIKTKCNFPLSFTTTHAIRSVNFTHICMRKKCILPVDSFHLIASELDIASTRRWWAKREELRRITSAALAWHGHANVNANATAIINAIPFNSSACMWKTLEIGAGITLMHIFNLIARLFTVSLSFCLSSIPCAIHLIETTRLRHFKTCISIPSIDLPHSHCGSHSGHTVAATVVNKFYPKNWWRFMCEFVAAFFFISFLSFARNNG